MFTRFAELLSLFPARLRGQEGQTMAEYALLLGLIVVVTATVVLALGGQISNIFTSVTNAL